MSTIEKEVDSLGRIVIPNTVPQNSPLAYTYSSAGNTARVKV